MEIRPCIIGPDLTIDPDIILIPFHDSGMPAPGLKVSSRELVLLIGENHDVALSLNLCANLKIKGVTGSNEAELTSLYEDGQFHLQGGFAGHYGNYYIAPTEDGLTIKGDVGKYNVSVRINNPGVFTQFIGIINGKNVNLKIQSPLENMIRIDGMTGEHKAAIDIIYTDSGIKVKGTNEGKHMEYTIQSLGDRIEMKGITREEYSSLTFKLLSETEIRVTGKSRRVPVDYNLTLYENGVMFKGNTGFYNVDYAFVTDVECNKA